MKTKNIVALVSLVAIASLGNPVHAQSPVAPVTNTEDYKLTGDSLEGINYRSAQDDFKNFFDGSISSNNEGENTTPGGLRVNESISLPDNSQLLQSVPQSVNGSEALQLQLDLENQ
ncbi:hypothetical protein Nos7524_0922 [Nostoc sp. PCC 7524]|uniref:hypothetical protein n=1 Tax=Nostoc sp. (strain ATCC 29411 / PCC 7524) TaxID=28072 RepID=UPI00029F3517|nr:hypothetical protein [Nostoc sp. PCC 7524]AFY46821.1 hypothetical protein Nos7524_0922 [Nostoc sp. PCC 7524]